MRRQKQIKLVVASRNQKKIKEIREILKGVRVKITPLGDYSRAPYITENGKTFKQNAIKKATRVARFARALTLGEDSGLEVAALDGKPGVYSSRFSGKDKNDLKNNLKLLKLLGKLPLAKRRARYVCSVALADKNGLIGVVEGYCSGLIGLQLRGSFGFGYDPLFIIPKYKKTFAQLGLRIKNKMSHRLRALNKAKRIIQEYLG